MCVCGGECFSHSVCVYVGGWVSVISVSVYENVCMCVWRFSHSVFVCVCVHVCVHACTGVCGC